MSISKKKSCVEIKNIKGKISKRVAGTFRIPIKIGKNNPKFKSLKKDTSSNKLSIKTKEIKIRKIFKNFFKNNLIIYNS